MDDVVITGMSVCHPLGGSIDDLVSSLLAGRDGVRPARAFDGGSLESDRVVEFPPDFDFATGGIDLSACDPGARYAVHAALGALRNAAMTAASFAHVGAAIVVGSSHSGIHSLERMYSSTARGNGGTEPTDFAGSLTDHPAIVLTTMLGSGGPRLTVSSACSSSNAAVGIGADLIRSGMVPVALIVGTDTVSLSILAGFNSLRAVSRVGAAPFSRPAGITLGEGACALLLESERHARARGAGGAWFVRGYALSGDAFHETAVDASGQGLEAAMRGALHDAGMVPEDVDYVSAHGTGTDANDIPESIATVRVFGDAVPVSSLKGFLGHTLGACGVMEIAVSIALAERGLVAPTAGFTSLRPGCAPVNVVGSEPRPARNETFISNKYGFGGNNASVVLSKHPPAVSRVPARQRTFVSGVGKWLPANPEWFDRAIVGPAAFAPDGPGITTAMACALPPMEGRLEAFRRSPPLIRFALAAAECAFSDAGIDIERDDLLVPCGVIGAVSAGSHTAVRKFMRSVLEDGPQFASASQFPLTTLNAAAGAVSIAYGLKGFNTTLVGGDAGLAAGMLFVRHGHQERLCVFGANEVADRFLADQSTAYVPSETGGDATLGPISEGATALVLETYAAMIRRDAAPQALLSGLGRTTATDAEGEDGICGALERAVAVAMHEAGVATTGLCGVVTVLHGPQCWRRRYRNAVAGLFRGSRIPMIDVGAAVGHGQAAAFPTVVATATQWIHRHRTDGGAVLAAYVSPAGDATAVVVEGA